MKTPKLKAKELVDRYYWTFGDGYLGEQHIQCALIAVDEMIKSIPCIPSPIPCEDINDCTIQAREFWQKVKKEIKSI